MINPWAILKLAPTADVRAIKRAYAIRLKCTRPEDDAEGFHTLRLAFEAALKQAEKFKPFANKNLEDRSSNTDLSEPTSASGPESPENLALPPVAQAAHFLQSPMRQSQPPPPERQASPLRPPKASQPPVVEISKLTAMRLATDVVGTLLPQIASAQITAKVLDQWLQHCPELLNFTVRDCVELKLLQSLAEGAPCQPDALLHLAKHFAWREIGVDRHLTSREPRASEWLRALENPLHIADFEHFIQHGPRLTNAAFEHPREVRFLRALKDGLTLRRKWTLALMPSTRKVMCTLVNAYRKQYGLDAADQVFGHNQLSFWDRINIRRGMNRSRFALWQLRIMATGFLFACIFLVRDLFIQILMIAGTTEPLFSQLSYQLKLVGICTLGASVFVTVVTVIIVPLGWIDRKIKQLNTLTWRLTLQWLSSLLANASLIRIATWGLIVVTVISAITKGIGRKMKQSVSSIRFWVREKLKRPD